jgi:hypothetical protein
LNKVIDRAGANDPQKRAEEIIGKLNKSVDGKLTKDEFVNG